MQEQDSIDLPQRLRREREWLNRWVALSGILDKTSKIPGDDGWKRRSSALQKLCQCAVVALYEGGWKDCDAAVRAASASELKARPVET